MKRVRVWTKNTKLREGRRKRIEREGDKNTVEQGVNKRERWWGRALPNKPF